MILTIKLKLHEPGYMPAVTKILEAVEKAYSSTTFTLLSWKVEAEKDD